MLNANNKLFKANIDVGMEINPDTNLKTSDKPCSEAGSEPDFDLNNVNKADLVSRVLRTEADKS